MGTNKGTGLLPYVWGLFLWFIFLFFQAEGIYGGDSGDLVTAAYLGGIPHPPGYPLYTALGFLLSKLPISTVAWRVGLLSSLAHAATATLVMLGVWRLTGRVIFGVFASLVLAANYLFFLYSTTPEVFALFDLFLIVLLSLIYSWRKTGKIGYLLWASFVFGLSLGHHHVILFFVPALFFWVWHTKRHKTLGRMLMCTLLGLFPYLYIPIAARGGAIINWDRPVDLPNVVRLVTRADYGSFVSSGFYGATLAERLIGLRTYLGLVTLDMTWVGLLLALLGIWWLWKKDRLFAQGLILGMLFLGPIFFFYASFPLVNRFTLGTFERFLLPTYVFFAVCMGMGLAKLFIVLQRFWWKHAVIAVLFLLPISQGGVTMWRFWGLRTDRTAQHLALDILRSVPEQSILLMQRDTPLFSTQYARYGLGERSDIKLIHSSRLSSDDYPMTLAQVFPELSIPASRGDAFVQEFLKINSEKFPIASITRLPPPTGWLWVPHGLVFVLTKDSQIPEVETLISVNEMLWKGFHDPEKGILGRYNHLMLADVRDVYATGRIELGTMFLRSGKLEEAKRQFEAATALGGDTQLADSFTYLGLTELFLEHCDEALSAFAKARGIAPTSEPNLILYEVQTWRDCVGDETRAQELFERYKRERESQETPLDQAK